MSDTQSDAAAHDLIHDPQGGMPRLLEIMRRLRDPETGCPWDVAQDFATIAPYTIEEAYEVADAIEREAWGELKGELGDLLFQSVFHAQMASERGLFTFDEVADTMSDKMVARHPHVFGDESNAKSPDQQVSDWEAIKAEERAARAEKGVLDGVALGLPALLRAVKLQKRAARVGFDWPSTDEVIDKIVEGKVNSYYQQVVLLEQPSIRDPKTSIGDLVTAAIATLGENITIVRFARLKVGETAD